MSRLTVWPDHQPDKASLRTEDPVEIAGALAEIGVRFERWSADRKLRENADAGAVLSAYAPEIDELKRTGGYVTADVIRLARDAADAVSLRAKFLDEHRHTEDEVRFFVEGSGAFYLHSGTKVHQVICAANDLLRVPANTLHWFDMGARPYFTAIRLFTNPEGWVAQFSGSTIAKNFPLYDGLP
jgi:1,2-dihydroxy-3-keto-5-methylthiopentene dioxygenase